MNPLVRRSHLARQECYPWLRPGEPCALAPGQVLLVSVTDERTALWSLSLGLVNHPRGARPVPVASHEIWTEATSQTHAALPLLWRSPPLPTQPPEVYRVAREEVRPETVGGASFGLSFLLAHASFLLEIPLPVDLVASAALGPQGVLGHVRALEHKIRGLATLAPQVRRLLVAKVDEEEARGYVEALEADVEIVAIGTIEEAVEQAFGRGQPLAAWRETPPEERATRVHSLYRLALADKHLTPRWQAVRTAADAALEWGLSPGLERRARFASAVAARHDGDLSVEIELPELQEVESWPQPERARRLAHLVQHAADTGQPDPERLLAWSEDLPTGSDAFPAHLKLGGARGRLLASLGRHEEAYDAQLAAALGWVARPNHDGLSFPLDELYRLASVLDDANRLGEAEEFFRSHQRLISVYGLPYVSQQRARAWITTGRGDTERIDEVTGFLETRRTSSSCGVAVRWLLWGQRRGFAVRVPESELLRDLDEFCRVALERAERQTRPVQRLHHTFFARSAESQRALVALDRGINEENEEQASRALEDLRRVQGPLVELLERHCPESMSLPAYVQRAFPY